MGRFQTRIGVRIAAWATAIVFALLVLEIGCVALVETGYIPSGVPSYAIPDMSQPFMADIDSHFGVWHYENRKFRHVKACFNVVYRSNSYGAVDKERSRRSDDPRVLVLGDSFVEGWGVAAEDRFTDMMEAATSIPHLNFGTSGNFGPTQYFMLYKHLARDFDHDTVLVTLLPDNDFRDDYPKPTRYQPYWKGEYPDYVLEYSLDSIEASTWSRGEEGIGEWLHQLLREFTYTANVFNWWTKYRSYLRKAKRKAQAEDPPYSGYFDYTPDEMLRLRYSLEQIRGEAGARRLWVISVPRLQDFMRFQQEGHSPLAKDLGEMAAVVGFEYFDLLPLMYESHRGNLDTLFHSCDGHWSPRGHRVAAEILLDVNFK